MKKIARIALLAACMLGAGTLGAQESIPDPLVTYGGEAVTGARMWNKVRRPELREFFEANMYGRAPKAWGQIRTQLLEEDAGALDGRATRRQVRIFWDGSAAGPYADVLIYLPNGVRGKVPVVVGLNFEGNHSVCADTAVRIPAEAVKNSGGKEIVRGFHAGQWPVEEIIERGYGVATAWRNEVSMDNRDRQMEGVRSVYPALAEGNENWATVSAWAWGLSRIADVLLKDKRVDDKRLAVLGFSRLGKASLWAGATDERFAATISECSGGGGAKLFHRNEGEKIRNLLGSGSSYWFCRNFAQYADRDTRLPFDQHQMMALIAPRALYVASATEDGYADPPGEYEALRRTAPVYALLGQHAALPAEYPAADTPLGAGTRLGYHVRTGRHNVTPEDWKFILDFLDKVN
jgi:hypothetical protein